MASTVRCKLESVKSGGISSNTTGRYFSLPRRRPMRGGQDAAVVEAHRLAERWRALARASAAARPSRRRFLEQAGLVEQFVALQHLLLVPASPSPQRRSRGARARARQGPARPRRRRHRGRRPGREGRPDRCVEDGRPAAAPILPRENTRTSARNRAPAGSVPRLRAHARQGEIADGDDVGAFVARRRVPAAVAEGVELLDIAERKAGLLGHEVAQADFQRAVEQRVEAARGRPARSSPCVRAARMRGVFASTATTAAARPISMGASGCARAIGASVDLQVERRALERIGAAPDGSDGVHHAPVAAEDVVGHGRRAARLGVAEGEASRSASASATSSRSGRSEQSVMKAAAVERLMPAQQWMSSGRGWSQARGEGQQPLDMRPRPAGYARPAYRRCR